MHNGRAELATRRPSPVRAVVTKGPSAGTVVALGHGPYLVGRHPSADIGLDDITVSLRHAVIAWVDGSLMVTDLGSLNGVYVNGERVGWAPLRPGDELAIGRFRMSLVHDETMSAA